MTDITLFHKIYNKVTRLDEWQRTQFSGVHWHGKHKININFLSEKGLEYSIDTTPANDVIKRYVNGDCKKQYLFVIRSVNDYGADALQNIANSGFFEKLSDWLEEQSHKGELPLLPKGKTAEKIEAQTTGYLQSISSRNGKYQIQCRLIYMEVK